MLAFWGYLCLFLLAVFVWTLILMIVRIISKKTYKQFGIIDAASYLLFFAACSMLIIKYEPGEETGSPPPAPVRTNLAISTDPRQTEQPRYTIVPASQPTASPAATVTARPAATPAPAVPTIQPTASTPAVTVTQPPVATAVPTAPPTQPLVATAVPTALPTQPPVAPSVETPSSGTGSASGGNADNFNTYNNPDQQKTEDTYVLNNNPDAMKIHYPDCRYVAKIAPQNYATSSESLNDLIAKNYSTCGVCFKGISTADSKPAQQPSEPSKESSSTASSTAGSTMVWIDDTAAKYHKKNGCGMDNAYQVTLEEARSRGKTPCGRCY